MHRLHLGSISTRSLFPSTTRLGRPVSTAAASIVVLLGGAAAVLGGSAHAQGQQLLELAPELAPTLNPGPHVIEGTLGTNGEFELELGGTNLEGAHLVVMDRDDPDGRPFILESTAAEDPSSIGLILREPVSDSSYWVVAGKMLDGSPKLSNAVVVNLLLTKKGANNQRRRTFTQGPPQPSPHPGPAFPENQKLPWSQPVSLSSSISGATDVEFADFDGDGIMDLAVAEGGKHASKKTFSWYEGPNFTPHAFNPSKAPGPFVGAVGAADIDGDGNIDMVAPADNHTGGSGHVYWFENPGGSATSTWQRKTIKSSMSNTEHIGELSVGDMDADGKLDVVIRHLGQNSVRMFFQNNPTNWSLRTLPVAYREGLSLGEINGDGRPDVLLNGFVWVGPNNWRTDSYSTLMVDSSFSSQPVQGLNNSTKSTVGDINNDGRDDILFSTAEGATNVLAWYEAPANPTSGTWKKHVLKWGFTNCHQALLGDVDCDGDLDVAGGYAFGQDDIFLYRNQNQGTQWKSEVISTSLGLYSGELVDLDGDGDLDLFGPEMYAGSGRVYIHYNDAF